MNTKNSTFLDEMSKYNLTITVAVFLFTLVSLFFTPIIFWSLNYFQLRDWLSQTPEFFSLSILGIFIFIIFLFCLLLTKNWTEKNLLKNLLNSSFPTFILSGLSMILILAIYYFTFLAFLTFLFNKFWN
jgi:hypothetical protein